MNSISKIIGIIILFIIQTSYSQDLKRKFNTKKIIEKRSLYINGGARSHFGGKSRVYIKIDLPPNTDHWYYSFSTSKGKSGNKNLNLAVQLTGFALDPSGITSTTLKAIDVPTGEASVDVYLLDNINKNAFINKEGFRYYPEGMVENTKQAAVRIDDVKEGTWYLGIRNPSSLNGLNFNIEVVAVQKNKKDIKDNTNEEKAMLYGNMGWSKFLKGEYQKSLDYCNKSNELFPLGWVQANKGLTMLALGKEIEATEVYVNALLLIKKQPKKDYVLKEILKDLRNLLLVKPDISGAKEIIDLINIQRIN